MRSIPAGQPRLSVVIPTRDCLTYLPATLASVLAQAVQDIEILVVDDGSSDGTWAWLQGQLALDGRIRAFRGEGRGPGAARNVAFLHARAPWIAFLDADDSWIPGSLGSRLCHHERSDNLVLSFADYRHLSTEGEDLGRCFDFWPRFRRFVGRRKGIIPLGDAAFALLFAENVVGTSTVVASRHALQNAKGMDEDLPSAEDWDLWLRLSRQGEVACDTTLSMNYLMRRPGAVTGNRKSRVACLAEIIERHRPSVPDRFRWSIAAARARLCVAEAELYRADGQSWRACLAHAHASMLSPSARVARACVSDLVSAIMPSRA